MNVRSPNDIERCYGRWQEQMADGSFRCLLCPRQCSIKVERFGFCKTRIAKKDGIYSSVYEKISSLAIDPIEKKPLYHFLPGSKILSLGTVGCNLGCQFCQNWHISQPEHIQKVLDEKLQPLTINQLVQLAIDKSIPSVAFTYNEPITFAEFAIDAASQLKKQNIYVVAVTAGYISAAARKDFFSVFDGANVDLKAFNDHFYQTYCKASLTPVLDTLSFIKQHTRCWLEITNLLIPGLNDDPKEIQAMTTWIEKNLGADTPLHFSAFHPDHKLTSLPSTPIESLLRAKDIAKECGLHYVYLGNVRSEDGSQTFCHHCEELLVDREHYHGKSFLKGSTCPSCQQKIPGFFFY